MEKKQQEYRGKFNFQGRIVEKNNFRAFVYNKQGEQLLAENYNEFVSLTKSGQWFDVPQCVEIQDVIKQPVAPVVASIVAPVIAPALIPEPEISIVENQPRKLIQKNYFILTINQKRKRLPAFISPSFYGSFFKKKFSAMRELFSSSKNSFRKGKK